MRVYLFEKAVQEVTKMRMR